MPLDVARVRQNLKDFDLRRLFTQELGWDRPESKTLTVTVEGRRWLLDAIAHKRGMVALHCPSPDGEPLPPHALRRKIEHQVTKSVHEHFIIFTDAGQTTQVWMWVKREPGRPTACRQHTYFRGQPGDGLIHKLQALHVTLDEEDRFTLVNAVAKAKAAFDVDKVTKRFYDRFQKEHCAFLEFLKGIPDDDLQRWYVSVMLNRLMFIYFVQSKGFLGDADRDYLRTKLDESKRRGKDRYYREFLCPLFFEGFAKRPHERSAAMNQLLGTVPYLNGGLFLRHQIEELHGEAIRIPDAAFERLFDFFRGYQWHLDERPLRADNEINPDVLGYIFEKYINQKQMGAYYTKEDITEYIAKNTIIPFLFDAAARKCPDGLAAVASVWRLLREDPDRYIYEAVRRGVVDARGEVLPESALPDFVRKGTHDPQARMFDRRYNLAEADLRDAKGEKLTLPTETWREYVVRRQRCLELREKLGKGEVRAIDDLITLNLDIRQFAQDAIADCQSPELLAAFFDSIRALTVLDPTCGSGAFLFAALNVLEPLYEACLDRMEELVNDDCGVGVPPARSAGVPPAMKAQPARPRHKGGFLDAFRAVLHSVNEEHPNAKYYIFKSIIIQNLFGVDIMEEATEICKLRLFLKLVAQVDPDPGKPNLGVEPLPDIDFNIRAGNTLVGYATIDDIRRGQVGKLAFGAAEIARLETQAKAVADRFDAFRRMQRNDAGSEFTPEELRRAKETLRKLQAELAAELDRYLAGEYGIDADNPKKAKDYQRWRQTHQPFHWFVEFHGIMHKGGFDAIIGNPPYVEYKDVKQDKEKGYTVRDFTTLPCGDLYAFVMERCYGLLRESGALGLIVPISVLGTDGFESLQKLTVRSLDPLWASFYSNRPAQLFEGAQKRLTVLVGRRSPSSNSRVFTSGYYRWKRAEREERQNNVFPLFSARLTYSPATERFRVFPTSLEKLGSSVEASAFRKLTSAKGKLAGMVVESSSHAVYYTRKFGYFLAFLDFIPRMVEIESRKKRLPSELKSLECRSVEEVECCVALLSSSTLFWFWNVLSDCRNLNRRDLLAFPVSPDSLSPETKRSLAKHGREYLDALKTTSTTMIKSGLRIETFDYAACKAIIDKVDCLLAQHLALSQEELDFIVNYDIKYRMGQDDADGDDE